MSVLIALTLAAAGVSSQSTTRPQYLDQAVVQHNGSVSTITANFPVPLFQALSGIRLEYGWQFDWEAAPCYSNFDVVDDTGPKWRSAHPDAKGVTRSAGGPFSSTFAEPPDASPTAKAAVLAKVIQDYRSEEHTSELQS